MNVETVKGCAYRNDKSTLNQNVPFDHAALEKALSGIKDRDLQGESLGVLSKDERDFAGRAEANRRRVLQEPGEAQRDGMDVGEVVQKRITKARKDFEQGGFDAYFEKENRRAFDSISPAVAKLSARNRQEVEAALVSSAVSISASPSRHWNATD